MMTIPIYQVDAFADQPFTGNPAAVCLLDDTDADASWMQTVASEMNLSETSFVQRTSPTNPANENEAHFNLRWFTPAAEVDLCGHATLASAHVLWSTDRVDPGDDIVFHTRSGALTVRRGGDWLDMDFPAQPPRTGQVAQPTIAALSEALGVQPNEVIKTVHDHLVVLDHADMLRAMQPEFAALHKVEGRGVIVTAPAGDHQYDFYSRFFAPKLRVSEDPVTGSTHCVLGPFWAQRLGKRELLAYQASRRGGTLRLNVGRERVHIAGQAIIVLEGALTTDAMTLSV